MDHIEKKCHLTGTLAEQSLKAADWFETLRDEICTGFEAIEAEADTTQLAIEKNRRLASLSGKTGSAMAAVAARYR